MTPKEWKFIEHVLTEICALAYTQGREDERDAKPLNTRQFKLSAPHKQRLRAELERYLHTS